MQPNKGKLFRSMAIEMISVFTMYDGDRQSSGGKINCCFYQIRLFLAKIEIRIVGLAGQRPLSIGLQLMSSAHDFRIWIHFNKEPKTQTKKSAQTFARALSLRPREFSKSDEPMVSTRERESLQWRPIGVESHTFESAGIEVSTFAVQILHSKAASRFRGFSSAASDFNRSARAATRAFQSTHRQLFETPPCLYFFRTCSNGAFFFARDFLHLCRSRMLLLCVEKRKKSQLYECK